jgi:hypothetical protein
VSEIAPKAGFSSLLLEGLDHYRKGKMRDAVRVWEAAYQLEPTNLRAREFLHSALQRIHSQMASDPALAQTGKATAGKGQPGQAAPGGALPKPPRGPGKSAPGKPAPSAHPWLRAYGLNGKNPKKPDSPWDDGPSVAIPQGPEPADEGNAGAWGIHAEVTQPTPPDEDEEIAILLRGARELLGLNDFSGARDLTAKILERRKGDVEAEAIHRVCEENLTQMYESSLGSLTRKPRVYLKPDEIIWLNLDPRAGFVLAQIDGEVSFEDLYAICGLSQLDTARILSQLLAEGVVSIQDDLPRP